MIIPTESDTKCVLVVNVDTTHIQRQPFFKQSTGVIEGDCNEYTPKDTNSVTSIWYKDDRTCLQS